MIEYLGFALAILVGISLGLIGSGGSILTIPILVYLMGIAPSSATTYSLFIVGVAAMIGSLKGAKGGLLDTRMALYFGLPGIVAIFVMRKLLLPLIPEQLFTLGQFAVTKDLLIMVLFSVLMILASVSMIKGRHETDGETKTVNLFFIIGMGILVGLITGFVGVGGGFLIIPFLVFAAKLPMKNAVATSLVIIAVNALVGFAGSTDLGSINWELLLLFTALSVAGILIGAVLSKKISNEKLKPLFGWFVLISGIYILIKETLLK